MPLGALGEMQKSPKVIAVHDARYHQLCGRFTDAAPVSTPKHPHATTPLSPFPPVKCNMRFGHMPTSCVAGSHLARGGG